MITPVARDAPLCRERHAEFLHAGRLINNRIGKSYRIKDPLLFNW